ncbi:MAG: roadblock/LC7 domain-containing protein [Deltaproteobacteria bacterium]|nr:roadblock/LC7 domain-containing protein [Deltaproteobacteria bacterium]
MIFTEILKSLSEKANANGAVMMDKDGEIVASWSKSADLDMELIGAHYEIVLDAANEAASGCGGKVSSITISTDTAKIAILAIKEEYCLVLALDRAAPSRKAMLEAARAVEKIEEEMG